MLCHFLSDIFCIRPAGFHKCLKFTPFFLRYCSHLPFDCQGGGLCGIQTFRLSSYYFKREDAYLNWTWGWDDRVWQARNYFPETKILSSWENIYVMTSLVLLCWCKSAFGCIGLWLWCRWVEAVHWQRKSQLKMSPAEYWKLVCIQASRQFCPVKRNLWKKLNCVGEA